MLSMTPWWCLFWPMPNPWRSPRSSPECWTTKQNIFYKLLNLPNFFWELGNEIRNEKRCLKKDKCRAPFQNMIAGGTRSLVRKRSQEKHQRQPGIVLARQDHLSTKIVLQVAKMCQARTADLCHARTQETRILNKPFFDLFFKVPLSRSW